MSDFQGGIEFNPQPAVRKNVAALIALSGPTGSGKTRGALVLARGLVGPAGKIVCLDTENRAHLYADDGEVGGFLVQQIGPPYSSVRYREFLRAAISSGADCVIVDSASHEWEGEGGMFEFAAREEKRVGGKFGKNWIVPKGDHQRYMNALCGARCHVIVTLREKQITDFDSADNRKKPVPVCEGGFLSEMLLHARLTPRDPERSEADDPDAYKARWIKVLQPLAHVFPPYERISANRGAMLRRALNGGDEADPEMDAFLRDCEERAREGGMSELTRFWDAAPPALRKRAESHKPRLGALARTADDSATSDAGASNDV